MKLAAAALALLLAGCVATTKVVTKPEVITVTKYHTVTRLCVNAADIPEKPKAVTPPDGDDEQVAAGIETDFLALESYIDKLLALLRGCTK